MKRAFFGVAVFAAILAGIPSAARGQGSAPGAAVTPALPREEKAFDPEAETRAYLAKMSAEKKARSDAYFEGGYWLQLWNFLYGVGVAWLLLGLGWSARMRNVAERVTRRKPPQTFLYWVQYAIVTAVLVFPLSVYQDFFREHQYGLATQTFGPWLGDQLKALAISVVFGGLSVTVLYGVLRRAPRTWWLWGALTAVGFLVLFILIAPVYFAPLFNKYTPLQDERIRGPILSLARANGIHAKNVYVVDASRQTTRISANVSGLFGTERISLNDNLLKGCSLPEIEAVMGHEMGHYVLNHIYKAIVFFGILIVIGFAFLRAGFDRVLRRKGTRWGLRGVGDVAGMPLFAILISCYFFVLTPITNSIIRGQEVEADMFGLNASRQPDGFAETALKLSDYRKINPSPLEEFVFFDHPSGRNRIFAAMRWKAEHLGDEKK
jgi:STE24 endopeptidase